jgi:predicted aspartyl protease
MGTPRRKEEGNIMEPTVMGRVLTEATIENLQDLWAAKRGLLPAEQVRRITTAEALVDTGATLLTLPTGLIQQLGLERRGTKRVMSSGGPTEAGMYEAVRLTIQGRDCTMDVIEAPDGVPVLIGQLPLEHLDLVVF